MSRIIGIILLQCNNTLNSMFKIRIDAKPGINNRLTTSNRAG